MDILEIFYSEVKQTYNFFRNNQQVFPNFFFGITQIIKEHTDNLKFGLP